MQLFPALQRHRCAVLVMSIDDPEELHCFVVYAYSTQTCGVIGFLVQNTPHATGPWDLLLNVVMTDTTGLTPLVRRVETVLQAIYPEAYMTQRKLWMASSHPNTPDFEETAAIVVIQPVLQRFWEHEA